MLPVELQALSAFFAGRSDCYGTYTVDQVAAPGKKLEGQGRTYPNKEFPRAKVVADLYAEHWRGILRLGIVPVFLDGTCKWFCIDIDNYELDHLKLAASISAKQLPLVMCRSKSGGAHLYCFLTEPVDAKSAIDLGKKWAKDLSYEKAEVFPKQYKFDSPEAKGNWIILPYFGGDKAEDFCLDQYTHRVDFHDFLAYIKSKVITPEEFKEFFSLNGKEWSQDDILENTPPCIRTMMKTKVADGDGRNTAASHLSYYFQKLDEFFETDNWQDKLAEFNAEFFDPPLGYRELSQIIKNHRSGKYKYRCDQPPMVSMCDKEVCLKCKFGIGRDVSFYGDVQISGITKIETGGDPIWKVYVNGSPVSMSTDALLTPRLFRREVMAMINVLISPMKQIEHDSIIGPITRDALVIEQAAIISSAGKIADCFRNWVSHTIDKSHVRGDILKGLPILRKDKKKYIIFFRINDLMIEYRRLYKEIMDDRNMFTALRSIGMTVTKYQPDDKSEIEVLSYELEKEDLWFEIQEGAKF